METDVTHKPLIEETYMNWTDSEVYGYALNYAKKQVKMFHGELQMDDLMQEFALGFLTVKRETDPKRDCDKTFMFRFTRKLFWIFEDLHKAHVRRRDIARMITVGDHWPRLAGTSQLQQVDVGFMIEESPAPIRAYLQANMAGVTMRVRETRNRYIQRITGMSLNPFYRLFNSWAASHLEIV